MYKQKANSNNPNIHICGILFCFNEEHIIAETLEYYISQNIDIVVFDNESTDSSLSIIKNFKLNHQNSGGKILDVVSVSTDGYEWRNILRTACRYMHRNLNKYEWIMLIDADAFYTSPISNMSLCQFIQLTSEYGYNIIDGDLYEFYPTAHDNKKILKHTERLNYFRRFNHSPQHKIFRYHPSVDFYTYSGHVCRRKSPNISVVNFIYKHYPWTSYEHGLKKIFTERLDRYDGERRFSPGEHWQYIGMLPIEADLIRKCSSLKKFSSKILHTKRYFKIAMTLSMFIHFHREFIDKFTIIVRKFNDLISDVLYLQKTNTLMALKHFLIHFVRSVILPTKTNRYRLYGFGVMDRKEKIKQQAAAFGLPSDYHFLLTNFCNKHCNFCNQKKFRSLPKKEMSFDRFATIFANLPHIENRHFCFSGGGEPFLCKDIFAIIRYVRDHSPSTWISIRTNGLKIAQFADRIANAGLHRLEISIHDTVSNESQAVFDGLEKLNAYLKNKNQQMHKVFVIVVSEANIHEVPKLILWAEKLDVELIQVVFCRYYDDDSDKNRIRQKESLYYHQQLYNRVMQEATSLARKNGIAFYYDPLFQDEFKAQHCYSPWETVLIDFNGEIYPCPGGEERFQERIQNGDYEFGNLLKKHFTQCWNSETYIKLRRTVSRNYNENYIPECTECHNHLCFNGPDLKSSHIIKKAIFADKKTI